MTRRLKQRWLDFQKWRHDRTLRARALRVHVPDPVPPPVLTEAFAGVGNVHDELSPLLSAQLDTVDKLDGKASGLIAFLAAALGLASTVAADLLSAIPHAQ